MASNTPHYLVLTERLEILDNAVSGASPEVFSLTTAQTLEQHQKLVQRFDFQGHFVDMTLTGPSGWTLIKSLKQRHPAAFTALLFSQTMEDGLQQWAEGTPGVFPFFVEEGKGHDSDVLSFEEGTPILHYRQEGADPHSLFKQWTSHLVGATLEEVPTPEELTNKLNLKAESRVVIHMDHSDALLTDVLIEMMPRFPRTSFLLLTTHTPQEAIREGVKKGGWIPLPYPLGITYVIEKSKSDTGIHTPRTTNKERILVVDDEHHLLDLLTDVLEEEDIYEVEGANNGEEALALVREKKFDAALLDYNLGDTTGLILAKEFHQIDPELNCILMTAHASLDMAVKAIQADIYDYLIKPVDHGRLKQSLSKALEKRRLALEIKALVSDLTQTNQKLNEVNEIKSKFLSIVSHDLRTPLTSIKGYAQMLHLQPDLPDEQKLGFLNTIMKEANHLEGLITDLMDFVSIEAGKLRVESKPTKIEPLLDDVMARMINLATDKKIKLEREDRVDAMPEFDIDQRRIDQVLTNLIGNAFKHTPENGTVTLIVEHIDKYLKLAVKDSGEGIPPEDLAKIFGQFYQVESHASKKEGVGLGLTISKEIIQAHGGDIGADSEGTGQGSTFWFTIPWPNASQ